MLSPFVLKRSAVFVWLLLCLYSVLIGSVWFTQLPLWAIISIILLIVFSFIHHLRCDVLRLDTKSWISFTLNQNRVVVSLRGGEVLSGELAERSVITPFCVVLCVKQINHILPDCSVIFYDAMQNEAFRELRVRLKYQ